MVDDRISRPPKREIVDSFVEEINKVKVELPETISIPYRPDITSKKVRHVYEVPTDLLRFRKENGRIASDVESYEKFRHPLDETKESDQKLLRQFLEEKDPKNTEILVRSLEHEGQTEPAVITADGFLINGNRRKLALEILQDRSHGDPRYARLRVVILPGKYDEGGEPTKEDIELLENAYQFHQDGKSEYYNFDRALSIRRKEKEVGISLEVQLKQDSKYANLDEKKFAREVKRYRDEFLGPLDCIDRYLTFIGRPGDYDSISGSKSDPTGSWQAFVDYYKAVGKNLNELDTRLKLNIEDNEISAVEDAAFKILRQRDFGGRGNIYVPTKINDIMRQIPKILKNTYAKNELLKLRSVPEGSGQDDSKWVNENHKKVSHIVTEAFRKVAEDIEREEPISKLERALTILNSEDINPKNLPMSRIPEGLKVINSLKDRVEELKSDFWSVNKSSKESLESLTKRRK